MFFHLTPDDFAIFLNENDNPDMFHFDVDADLVEWEPNMFRFIPDSFNKVTHHLERFVIEIGLCGCIKLSSNWFVPPFLKGAVILIWYTV